MTTRYFVRETPPGATVVYPWFADGERRIALLRKWGYREATAEEYRAAVLGCYREARGGEGDG